MNVSLWNQPQTTIGHLRARYSGSQESIDKTALRLRVERLLDNADLCPPGLSSGAVLIVRRLDSLASVSFSSLSQPVFAGWQVSLREQLAAMYAAAARPALGAVPLNAPSVLFTDPGEMLICLTRDLLNGQAEERWFWQQALRGLSLAPGSALPALWCAHAAFLPTVLATLRPSEVFNAITCFGPQAIEQVIHSLHESFALPSEALAAIVSRKPEGNPVAQTATDGNRISGEASTTTPSVANLPPWEKWLPATTLPALSTEARYLLGLGLALHHAPAFVRSARFAARSASWLRSKRKRPSTATEPPRAFTEHGSTMETARQHIVSPEQDRTGEQTASILKEEELERTRRNEFDAESHTLEQQATMPPGAEPSPIARDSKNSLDDSFPVKETRPTAFSSRLGQRLEESEVSRTPEMPLPPVTQTSLQQAAPTPSTQAVQSPSALSPSQPLAPGTPGVPEARSFVTGASMALPADGVFTRLGGVFYLINLLTGLNLLHSWERDGTFAEYVSGWAIVEALARGLLSLCTLQEHYVQDPIWYILALLDGREPGTPIAANDLFRVEDAAFHLPPSWLQRSGSALWSAIQHGERLLLYDSMADFLIADVPLRGRSFFEAAHTEVEAYREQGLEAQWSLGSPVVSRSFSRDTHFFVGSEEVRPLFAAQSPRVYMDEQVLWWLERVLGFVYCLLARVLGVPFDEPARLAELALCRHGLLIASRTHIDLYMSMEEIIIAVRRAGLDCDPGWVPDLARIVYFHFD